MRIAQREIWLVRHGETAWSLSGQHTGTTDLPLLPEGEERARALQSVLFKHAFTQVWSSPLQRARCTAQLAGYADVLQLSDDLREWNYGRYEGLTTKQIRESAPGWTVWTGPVPDGETVEQVAARADRVLQGALSMEGDTLLFAHGHILRVLAARWLGLPGEAGRHFALSTGTVCVLSFERETPVLLHWNVKP